MNKTLYQLAYRNIKKHKKYYAFVCILIFGIAFFLSTFMVIQKSNFQVNRVYNERKYGYWYVVGTIEEPIQFDTMAKAYEQGSNDRFLYTYLYNQGSTRDDMRVGYASKNFFEVCGNKVVQGKLPKEKNQIAITVDNFEKNHYQLYQTIDLELSVSEQTEYEIVGVVLNSQEGYFPDIYTAIDTQYESINIFSDRELMVENNIERFSGCSLIIDKLDEKTYNRYSYNHLPSYAAYLEKQMDMIILLEGALLVGLVLIALTSIALKKRTHEFALLRGIGMTTKQMILMSLSEYMMCTVVATFLGTITSIGGSYGIMYYIKSKKDIFYWLINGRDLCIYAVIVISCVLMGLLYPITQSSKQALSGTFEGKQFQYIQIRYRQLFYQNKWRLAWRELKINKKIHIFLIIVLSFHSSLILINQVIKSYNQDLDDINSRETVVQYDNAYLSMPVNSQDELEIINSLPFDKTMYVQAKSSVAVEYKDKDGIIDVVTTPVKNIEKLSVKGKMPENEKEVLMFEDSYFTRMIEEDASESSHLLFNDELVIGENTVRIVGVIEPMETREVGEWVDKLEAFGRASSGLYIIPSLYQNLQSDAEMNTIQIFYNSPEQRDEYKKLIYAKSLAMYENIDDYGEWVLFKDKSPVEIYLNSYILVMTFIVCTLLGYVFNKYEMENRRNDYSLYQLIGMTKKDILKKQMCKGMIVCGIIEMVSLVMLCIECLYLEYWALPIQTFMGLTGILLMICLIVYGLPLRFVLSNQPLDDFHQVD